MSLQNTHGYLIALAKCTASCFFGVEFSVERMLVGAAKVFAASFDTGRHEFMLFWCKSGGFGASLTFITIRKGI